MTFVSAIIGGFITALFIVVGMPGMKEESGDVTIKEVSPPAEGASEDGVGPPVSEVYTQSGPGVVSVDVASSERGPTGGSGFVLDKQGHIVTNQHVVEGAEDISVRFASGVREEAQIVGEDPSTDVAIVKVDASEGLLEPLTLGDTDSAEVGEPVIAIGNPLNVRDQRHDRGRQRRRTPHKGPEQLHHRRCGPDRRDDKPWQLRRVASRFAWHTYRDECPDRL
jgi:putative serine protease PepD